MSFIVSLVFKLAYLVVVLAYPIKEALNCVKNKEPSRLWLSYFLFLGVLTLLEGTVLFPVKYLLNMLCSCTWSSIKFVLCLWLYHSEYKGALFINQITQPFIEMYYPLVAGPLGKVLSLVGLPTRKDEETTETKKAN